jgi:hypothetical protein
MAVTTITATEIREHHKFLLDHIMATLVGCRAQAINTEAAEVKEGTATVSLVAAAEVTTIFIPCSRKIHLAMPVIRSCMAQIIFTSST